MNPELQFQAAIAQEVVWKNDELKRFAVSLVRHALELDGGRATFTTDIVPEEDRGGVNGSPAGSGIAGSVVELLKNANLIVPVGHKNAAGQWFALRQRSTRPDRKGAWLCAYQLTNPALARAFLQRHGSPAARLVQTHLL